MGFRSLSYSLTSFLAEKFLLNLLILERHSSDQGSVRYKLSTKAAIHYGLFLDCFLSARLARNLSAAVSHQNMKRLFTEVARLKRLAPSNSSMGNFILEKSPFDEDDDEGEPTVSGPPYIIIGRILPSSEIFNQSAFRIEIKVPSNFPFLPPDVRVITPIYHPNVDRKCELIVARSKMTNLFRL